MPLTRSEARDEMLAVVKAAVDADNAATGRATVIHSDDVREPEGTGKEAWLRPAVRHGDPGGHSLGPVGKRRFSARGAVVVQVFTPEGDGFTLSDSLVKVLADAFRPATPGGVWFTGSTAREVGRSGPWTQVNFSVGFEYDEIG